MIQINQINAFVAVVETGHFSHAAERLGLTAAGVGKLVKTLEASLGLTLFYRTSRVVTLTDIGRVLYDHCLKVQGSLSDIQAISREYHGHVSGVLKVHFTHFLSTQSIARCLESFCQKYPQIQVDIALKDAIVDIEQNDVDITVGLGGTPYENLVQKLIYEDKHILCASPTYLEQYGVPTPATLANHRFITHKNRPSFDTISNNTGMSWLIKPALVVDNSNLMLELCHQHQGVGLFLQSMACQSLESGRLVPIMTDYVDEKVPIYLYYKKSQYAQPKVRAFMEHLFLSLKAESPHYF